MNSDITELVRCKKIIEQKLGWGAGEHWQGTDFENLNELILRQTGVSLSVSTLRRIWGRVEYNHLPSLTTLNTLARFAGYDDWRTFIKQQPSAPTPLPPDPQREKTMFSGSFRMMALISGAIILLGLAGMLAFEEREPALKRAVYHFESRPVIRGIPNSVVFTYDASSSPTDSVFIQQSWDNGKRTAVDKNLHTHTSIYYKPGFYRAKLVIGKKVVKEHKLQIATNGWLGTIEGKPVPIYLKHADFIGKDRMFLPVSAITERNISLQPQPTMIQYFNVGNFKPVPLKDFSFSTDIKNDYQVGAGACQLSSITLVTDDMPVTIPLSAKGCVSENNMLHVDKFISGKTTDLSAFGVDFSDWNQVGCKSGDGKLRYYVNGKLALEFPLPKREIHIIGLCYSFLGTGSVRNIKLESQDKSVFQAF
jgi:hypothetical protein